MNEVNRGSGEVSEYGTLLLGEGAIAIVVDTPVVDRLDRFTPHGWSAFGEEHLMPGHSNPDCGICYPEETFVCWRCEEDRSVEEKTPIGLEYVCEGCSE
jgi:hypothetical protein